MALLLRHIIGIVVASSILYVSLLKCSTGDGDGKGENLASARLGAYIDKVCARPREEPSVSDVLFDNSFKANPPVNMLNANMKRDSCFAFRGHQAQVIIMLSEAAYIDVIEIQHIAKAKVPCAVMESAPKDFTVYGLDVCSKGVKPSHLGDFQYKNQCPVQSFRTKQVDKQFQRIRLDFKTNHGNPEYTSVYQVAVYGH